MSKRVTQTTIKPALSALDGSHMRPIPVACVRAPATQAEHDLVYDLWFILRFPGTRLKPLAHCMQRAVNHAIIDALRRHKILTNDACDPHLAILLAADIWDVIASNPGLVDIIRIQDAPGFVQGAQRIAARVEPILTGHAQRPALDNLMAPGAGAAQSHTGHIGASDEAIRTAFETLNQVTDDLSPGDLSTITNGLTPEIARTLLHALHLLRALADEAPGAIPDPDRLFNSDAASDIRAAANAMRAHDAAASQRMNELSNIVQKLNTLTTEDLRSALGAIAHHAQALALLAAASIADRNRLAEFLGRSRQRTTAIDHDLAYDAFRDAAHHVLGDQSRDAGAPDSLRINAANHLLAQDPDTLIPRMRAAREEMRRISNDALQRAADALRRLGALDGEPGSPPDAEAMQRAACALRGDRIDLPAEIADAVDQAMQDIRKDAVRTALAALQRADIIPDSMASRADATDAAHAHVLEDIQNLLNLAHERPDDLAQRLRAARKEMRRISNDALQRAADALRRLGALDGEPGSPPDAEAMQRAERALRGDRIDLPAEIADAVDQAMQDIREATMRQALAALQQTALIADASPDHARDDAQRIHDLLDYDDLLHRLAGMHAALSEDDAQAIYRAIQEAGAHQETTLANLLEQHGIAMDDSMDDSMDNALQSLLDVRSRLCADLHVPPDANIEDLVQRIHEEAIRRIIGAMRRNQGRTDDAAPFSAEERHMAHAFLQSLFESPTRTDGEDISPGDRAWLSKALSIMNLMDQFRSGDANASVSSQRAPSGNGADSAQDAAGGASLQSGDGDVLPRDDVRRPMHDLALQMADANIAIDFESLSDRHVEVPETDTPYAEPFEAMLNAAESRSDRRRGIDAPAIGEPSSEPMAEPQSALHPARLLNDPMGIATRSPEEIRDEIARLVQQANAMIEEGFTPDAIEKALQGTVNVSAVLSDFGIGPGELQATPIEDIVALAGMIGENPDLHDMLIAFESVNRVLQNVAIGDGSIRDPFGMPTIEQTDDLFSVLAFDPSIITPEPAITAARVRELVEGALLGFVQPPERSSRGPLICAIDDSGSMSSGGRRTVAHAIALAMAAEAIREGRETALIKFSGSSDPMEIFRSSEDVQPAENRLAMLKRLLTWAQVTIGQNTDFDRPLSMIAKIASASHLRGCDAVFITDAACSISQHVADTWRAICEERDMGMLAFIIGGERQNIANLSVVATDIYEFPLGEFTIGNRDQIARIIAAFLNSRKDGRMRHSKAAERSEMRQRR